MNSLSRTVKLFVIYLFIRESAALKEGDSCKLDDGSHGVCTLITKCVSAQEALDQGDLPRACYFIGTVIVACCKDNVASISHSAPRESSFPAPPSPQTTPKSNFDLNPSERSSGLVDDKSDSCKLDDGSLGVCTIITKCRSALKALDQGVLPRACYFIGTVIVACCKDNVAPISRSAPRVPSFPAPPLPRMIPKSSFGSTPSKRTPGLVAEKKCKEYSKYAKERKETDTLSLISMFSETLECAIDSQPLIIGGTLAAIKEFPHMALIGYQQEPMVPISWNCGGTLISHNFVLTAVHCFHREPNGFAKFVRVGITNQTDLSSMQQLEVQQLIPYPERTDKKYHDIGLLKLASYVQMNPYARAACLFTERKLPNTKVIASGWGVMEETGNPSNNLLKVNLELFPHDVCDNIYRTVALEPDSLLDQGIVDDWMICAGSTEKIKDACRGDSGGPLQIVREDTDEVKCMYNIIGITSFGKGCGLAKNQPGVYTRVSNYISWIEDEVWPNEK